MSRPRSLATRLRRAFLAVVVAFAVVAALVTVVLVRQANRDDTSDDALRAARSGAGAVSAQVVATLADGRPASVIAVVGVLQSALEIQDARIIRIRGDRLVGLTPDGGERSDASDALVARLIAETDVTDGGDGVVADRDRVVAVAAVPFSDQDASRLQLGDDVIAVMAVRQLGPAGLGPAAVAVVLATVFALLVAVALAEVLSRRIRRPLAAMAQTARTISAGDLSARVVLTDDADRELLEVAGTLDRMAERLDHAQGERRRFLVDVSHEFRTPLTSIRGYAELLEDGALTGDHVPGAGAVIGREAARLERMTDDLLAQARLDAGEMAVRLAPVEIGALVGERVEALRPGAARAGIDLVWAPPTSMIALADPERLRQIVDNLVDNAIGFAHSRVHVSVPAGERPTIVVADDGPGLGGAGTSVFDRAFSTPRPRDRRRSRGTDAGVGLSVVAGLVAAMGGAISATDGEQGARFVVALRPAGPSAGPAAAAGGDQAATPT